jgi:hypothetical protein
VAKATGPAPYEVLLGEAGRPVVDRFATVLGGKLQEAKPKVVKEFGQWVAEKMKKLKQDAKNKEDHYLEQEREQYGAGVARDGVKTAKHQIFQPGQLVMVKIPVVGAFG